MKNKIRRKVLAGLHRWQLQRFRSVHAEVSGYNSPTPGYAGLLEELSWSLRELDADTRENIDKQAIAHLFGGKRATEMIAWISRRAPRASAALLARIAPVGLRFLVGEFGRSGSNTTNEIPVCRFRIEGGETMCREACQLPTEKFCSRAGFPIVLEPSANGQSCAWRWGERRP